MTDREAWRRERPFRVAVIEQCTYDGTIYDARMIVQKIGHLCDYILFDEAWAGFMKFHPLFQGRYAMGLTGLDETSPGIVATQSTHKQLASFSQASQIHTKDSHIRGQTRGWSTSGSTRASSSTPRPRPSTRSSPRSMSARR